MPFDLQPIWEPDALLWDDQLTAIFSDDSSVASDDMGSTPYVASKASRQLKSELDLYAGRRSPEPQFRRPLISGRSVLIAGQRGSGKTGTALWVIRELQAELIRQGQPVRLLPVPITASAFLDIELPDEDVSNPKPHRKLLLELCCALHRAVLREFLARMHASVGDSDELAEMLAQFEQDVEASIDPRTLRDHWRRFQYLSHDSDGTALFRRNEFGARVPGSRHPRLPANQSTAELGALTTFNELYLRLIGQLFSEQADRDEKMLTRGNDAFSRIDGSEWRRLLASLLSGGLVATGGAATNCSSATALFAGLLTSIGTGLGLSLFGTWKQQRSQITNRRFTRDYSLKTLHRDLPRIVDALKKCGISPVFLVDELDKRKNLIPEIETALTHLKQFFAEKAFFCFLTHRQFFDDLSQQELREPAGVSTTWFGRRIFVEYLPGDIRRFIRHVIRVRPATLIVADPIPDGWTAPEKMTLENFRGFSPDTEIVTRSQGTPAFPPALQNGMARTEDVAVYKSDIHNRILWELVLVKRAAGSMAVLHSELTKLQLLNAVPDVVTDDRLMNEALLGLVFQLVIEDASANGLLEEPGSLHVVTMALSVLARLMDSTTPIDLSAGSDFFTSLSSLLEDAPSSVDSHWWHLT